MTGRLSHHQTNPFGAALMTRFSLLSFAAATIVISITAAIPQQAWSADMPVPKPVVQQETPSDWRTRLFEEFQRYLHRRNP